MNKCLIKAVAMFSAGFGTCYLVMNKMIEKKHSDRADAEMEAYRMSILGQVDDGEIVEKEDLPDGIVLSDDTKGPSMTREEAEKVEYNVLSGSYTDKLNKKKAATIGMKPYEINEDEYTSGRLDFDKGELRFFADDEILCGEDEEPIANINLMVGENMLERFGDDDLPDPDIIYVRNEQQEIDFEIICIHGSYKEMVQGYSYE